jgi:hypothetical protein
VNLFRGLSFWFNRDRVCIIICVSSSRFSADTRKQKIKQLWKKVRSLNLFDSDSNNLMLMEREKKMTLLYVFLLMLTFTTLAFHTGLSRATITYTVKNPSQSDYLLLHAKYPDTLECPCTQQQIGYFKLIHINIKYHQICTSGFVSPFFIGQLYTYNATDTHPHDFMAMSGVYFTHIGLFCQGNQKSVNDLYKRFWEKNFVSMQLMVSEVFETRLNSDLRKTNLEFLSNWDGGISSALELLINSYAISRAYTSFNLRVVADGSIQIEPTGFANCSCIKEPKTCSTDTAFYAYSPSNGSLDVLSNIMGVRLGCSPVESTLQSSLACWYSSECYEMVREIFDVHEQR